MQIRITAEKMLEEKGLLKSQREDTYRKIQTVDLVDGMKLGSAEVIHHGRSKHIRGDIPDPLAKKDLMLKKKAITDVVDAEQFELASLEDVWSRFDDDKSGSISLGEFVTMITYFNYLGTNASVVYCFLVVLHVLVFWCPFYQAPNLNLLRRILDWEVKRSKRQRTESPFWILLVLGLGEGLILHGIF